MSTISVIITSFNDFRVLNLVPQILNFSPFEIIVADGGSSARLVDECKKLVNDTVKFYNLPGNIAETRYQVQFKILGDIAVFIDTDEIPREDWLDKLIKPIVENNCDFTFGSTTPLHLPDSRYSKYLSKYDKFLYENILPVDILKGAMGNSAWRTSLIKDIGFDPCLGIGGEDYDLVIRAVKSGYQGCYRQDAVLYHDQNGIRSLRKFLKKVFYNYMVGASLAYRKNSMLFKRTGKSLVHNVKFKDPFEILIFILKPFALIFSLMLNPWEDERLCKHKFMSKKE